jgi:hypothetical protein
MRRFDAAIWLQATGRFFDLASLNNSTTYHDPSRLVLAKQLGRRSPARLVLEINVSELLPAVVAHDKAGIQFLDGPGRPEASDAEAITSYCQRAKKAPCRSHRAQGEGVDSGPAFDCNHACSSGGNLFFNGPQRQEAAGGLLHGTSHRVRVRVRHRPGRREAAVGHSKFSATAAHDSSLAARQSSPATLFSSSCLPRRNRSTRVDTAGEAVVRNSHKGNRAGMRLRSRR